MNITTEDIGFYVCKLINEVGMTSTRGKFDISNTTTTTTTMTEVSHKNIKTGKKKSISKKPTAYIKQKPKNDERIMHKTEISIVTAQPVETHMHVVRVRQPVSILVEESGISDIMEVKDRKEIDKEEEKEDIKKEISETIKESTFTQSIKITEEIIKSIRSKISQKSITIEDMLEIKQHDEVNALLTEIEAETFGSIGEAALRDLATIGLLLRHGCNVIDIIYMYEQNIFISLKKPESQAALVQLVERESHEELITQILTESSTEDETILAATVGFKAFIRMIQTCEITIETVIRKFVREDFITQDWKISGKEV